MNESNAHREFPGVGRVHFHSAAKLETGYLYREIFKDNDYLRNGIELHADDTVFDVGANIGLFSLFAAQKCNGRLKLFGFEPVPQTFHFLQKNLEYHGLLGGTDVHLFNLGLTSAGGPSSVEFTYYENAPANSTMKPSDKQQDVDALRRWVDDPGYFFGQVRKRRPILFPLVWVFGGLMYPVTVPFLRRKLNKLLEPTTVVCELTTMSAVIEKHDVERIDLLKIDVEGAELDVLQGIAAEDWPKIQQVVVEVHDIDGRLEATRNLLLEQGLKQIVVERRGVFARANLNIHNVYARRPAA